MTRRTVDEYRACAEAGMTMREAAEDLGVSYATARSMASKNGIAFQLQPKGGVSFPGLTPEQRRDARTYFAAGYSHEEASAKATAPRVKIRATPTTPEATHRPAQGQRA